MLIDILVQILAILLFLFIYWKRLKEDYSTTLIFNSAFLVAIFVLVGGLIAFKYFSDWWFWYGLIGALIGFSISTYRHRLAFYESLEALVIGLLPWLGVILLWNFIVNRDVATGIGVLIISVLLFAYLLLNMHYKTFSWYRSGRVGFSGLTILGTFFFDSGGYCYFFSQYVILYRNI